MLQIWSMDHSDTGDSVIHPPSLKTQYTLASQATCVQVIKKNSSSCTIVSGHANGEVMLFNATFNAHDASMTLAKKLKCHTSPITSLDICDDRIMTSAEDGKVTMFDVNSTLKQTSQLTFQRINTIRFREPQTIVLGSHSNEIQIWDMRQHVEGSLPIKQFLEDKKRPDVDRSVWSIDFHESYFVSGTGVGSQGVPPVIMIHDEALKEPYPIMTDYRTHKSDIWKVQFLEKARHIVSCDDNSLYVSMSPLSQEYQESPQLSALYFESSLPLHTFAVDVDHSTILGTSEEEVMYATKYSNDHMYTEVYDTKPMYPSRYD